MWFLTLLDLNLGAKETVSHSQSLAECIPRCSPFFEDSDFIQTMRHLPSQIPPPALAKLNPAIHMNDEHKFNYVNLQTTASERTLGGDLSYKCSQATCTAMIFMHEHYLPEKAL